MSKMTNAEARKIVEDMKVSIHNHLRGTKDGDSDRELYLMREEALQILLDCEAENEKLTQMLNVYKKAEEGFANEIRQLKAEKDHLRGIKFVPHMQSWEDLTAERDRLKKEVERLKASLNDYIIGNKDYETKCEILKAELARIKAIGVEIEDTLAQPPDRISRVTIESYSKIRQEVLAIVKKIKGE